MAEGKSSGSGLTIVLIVLCAAAAAGAYHHFIEVPNQKAKDKNPDKKDDKKTDNKEEKPEEKGDKGGSGSGGSGGSGGGSAKGGNSSNSSLPYQVNTGGQQQTQVPTEPVVSSPQIYKSAPKLSFANAGKPIMRRGDDGVVYEVLEPVSREFGVNVW